ncbi:hypothetical protein Cgig2_023787 [Carnegiea gigantea]|uniref:CCHC-type domain-containing protein n=1 Tax=Carnegiea gigantea TaxID=171969 RepID=A0A9Q1JR65_9CARY|nr:hypothetical protein Cgig2_023787 [Carnegiea gigantea]
MGKVMLPGGRKDCVWVKENMGVLEVLRIVEEAMGEGTRGQRMWYRWDSDVKKLMKENDEYAYLYVAESKGRSSTDRGRGGATIDAAGDIAHVVDGRIVTEQKLGLKLDRQKTELEKWKNGVGDRIEKKLRKRLGNIDSVADVKLLNTALGEYGVLLMNNHSLVVTLAKRKCSCKWWQLKGLSCAHAMTVIEKKKLWVYDYVSECCKEGSQNKIHMNSIHPTETHDSATADNTTGLVVGGEALDDGNNRRILPSLNPHLQGRPRKRRIESQRQGVQVLKCSKCGEVGHYRNTCRNPRADFNADETTVVVPVEDLFKSNYIHEE